MVGAFWEKHPRLAASVGVLCGLVFLLIAYGGYDADRSLDERGVETEAIVEKVLNGRDPQYRVRFTLPDGRVISTRTDYAVGDAEAGDRIRVEYDPEYPETVSEVGSRDGAALLYGGFGVVGLAAVGHALWRLRHPKQPR